MNIIVQNTGGDESSLNDKIKSTNKTFDNITRDILLNSSEKKNFCDLPISITYVSPVTLIIGCVVLFITSYCMEQDLNTNISKYGV